MNSRLPSMHGFAGALVIAYCMVAAAEEPEAKPSDPAAAPERKLLDLRAPDIRDLFTPQQIAAVLASTRDRNIEEVEVEGVRGPPPPSTPEVWGAIAAPFWALLHPTQAWRILAPIPPDRARAIGAEPPDATSTQREPATGIPPMAGD
ncbi:MAG: hypothetical protein ACREV5_18270 [Steroidobacter sp.]